MKKHIILLCCILIGFSACIKEPEEHSNSIEGNFDALWQIIDTRYCFLDYKNIDWDSVYVAYHQKAHTVSNKYEMFDLFTEMLNILQDGHVNLYSEFDISRYHKFYTDSADNFYSDIIYSENYLGKDYRKIGGMNYKKIKNGKIGYIYYGSFSTGFSDTNMNNIFYLFSDCDGIIIDVRDNGGGSLSYSEKLASYFHPHETTTGYILHKTGGGHSDFSEPTEIKTPSNSVQWQKPVAILTNRSSYSATNDFVNRVRTAPKAFTVGSWTGGGSGLPLSSELPIGWMVRFSACPILDMDMNHTEFGIAPDYWVLITDADKSNDIDTVIEKAVSIIEERSY